MGSWILNTRVKNPAPSSSAASIMCLGIPRNADWNRRKSKPMPIHTVRIMQVYSAVSRLSNHPRFVPKNALTQPSVGLNMDLKIMQAADMDTAMGRVNMVSYTGLSLRFFVASSAREIVSTSVTGTLISVMTMEFRSAFLKSFRPKTYLKFSSPAKRRISPLSLTAQRLLTSVFKNG